ncbi:galactose-6-phosphate isomerase subunit LacA [Amedibacterium intestinale]|uniref:galactose-6-phosphate isomerase subunit LacA n=1 Tax=Amedibacterium intestinale TaxID=2583452 RepID=UPI000E2045D4
MKIVISSDKKGLELKNKVVDYLTKKGFTIEDLTPTGDVDFYEASIKVVNEVLKDVKSNKGIIIDEYGVGPFMVADKFKYIICAELNDEHSAKMTRDHNNANVITMGSGVIGEAVACKIAERFCVAKYSGGRHQIRIDMLNKMC